MLRQTDDDTDLRKQMFALAMSTNKAREVSAQEVVWILLSLPIVEFSREVIDVPVSPIHTRARTVPSQNAAEQLDDTTTDWEPNGPSSKKGLKQLYAARPADNEWDRISLHTFVSEWMWLKKPVSDADCIQLQRDLGYVVRRKRVAVINPIPHYPVDFTKEESCNATIILHVPWRTEEEWYSSYATAVEALAAKITLLPQHLQDSFVRIRQIEAAQEQIRNDAANGIPPVNRFETDVVVDDTTAEELDSAYSHEQLHVSPSGSPTVFAYGTGQFAPRTNYTRDDFLRAKKFVDDQKQKLALSREANHLARQYDEVTNAVTSREQEELRLEEMVAKLNVEQRFAYNIAVHHMLRDDEPNRIPLRLFVSGPGGTGKSFLIACIVAFVRHHFGHTPGRFGSVSVTAPTGAAACNISGSTYHSAFRIFRKRSGLEPDQVQALKSNLQTDLSGVRLFIIDEVSMLKPEELITISSRLQFAFPLRESQPYGGANMIFLGDFYQLAPIAAQGGCGLYSTIDPIVKELWIRQQDAVVLLVQQMRHTDTGGGPSYSDINMRARDATITQDDLKILNSRALTQANGDPYSLQDFSDRLPLSTPVGVYSNKEVATINDHRLSHQPNPLVNCWAKHSWPPSGDRMTNAKCLNHKKSLSMPLDPCVTIAVGAPVMLLKNLVVELGLVNGSIGTVYDIMYNTVDDGPINPQATKAQAAESRPMLAQPIVLVKFTGYRGDTFVPGEEKIVPIQAIDYRCTDDGNSFTRWQLPLRLAYSITIHKLQGMTLDTIALDLSSAKGRGLAYVGISRVRKLDGLYLREKITKRKFTGADTKSDEEHLHDDYIYIAAEYRRLRRIATSTIARYTTLFNSLPTI